MTYNRSSLITVSTLRDAECPQRYFLKYVKKVKTLPSPALELGTRFHQAIAADIETYTVSDLPNCHKRLASVYDDTEWNLLISQFSEMEWPENLNTDTFFFESVFYLDAKGTVCQKEKAAFAGTIDLWYWQDETIHILDWKTSRSPDSFAPDDLQLRLYSFAMAHNCKSDQISLEKVFVRFPHGFRRMIYSRDMLEPTWNEICDKSKPIFHGFKTGDWPAIPNEYCPWCQVSHECPEYQDAHKSPVLACKAIAEQSEALQVAVAVRMAEARIKDLKGQMQEWVERYGAIYNPDTNEYLDFVPGTKDEIDNRTALSILRSAGIGDGDILDKMKLTKGAIDKLINANSKPRSAERKELKSRIRAAFQPGPKSTFKWRKDR